LSNRLLIDGPSRPAASFDASEIGCCSIDLMAVERLVGRTLITAH
jgi:hypothetical protein